MSVNESPPVSIARLAELGQPLCIPWSPKTPPIRPGTLFRSKLWATSNPWSQYSPFDPESLNTVTAEYRNDDGGSATFQSVETTSTSNSEEHLSVSFGISVGCKWLNANVTGGYDKDTLENNDARKFSTKASFRAGSIAMRRKPSLSLDALCILKHQGGLPAFKALYGDYYVAGYQLGGDAAVLLSETSMTTATLERLSVKVTAQVLFVKASKTHAKFFRSAEAESGFRVSGFDTLDQLHLSPDNPVSIYTSSSSSTGAAALGELATTARDMELRCIKLAERVTKKVEESNLEHGQEVGWESLELILRSNLVLGIILLPVTALRPVLEWSLSKDVIGF